jgi:hypothetical protein
MTAARGKESWSLLNQPCREPTVGSASASPLCWTGKLAKEVSITLDFSYFEHNTPQIKTGTLNPALKQQRLRPAKGAEQVHGWQPSIAKEVHTFVAVAVAVQYGLAAAGVMHPCVSIAASRAHDKT